MLDGLKGPDGSAELDPHLGVLHAHVKALLGATDLLGRQSHGRQVQHLHQVTPALAVLTDERAGSKGELHLGLLTGLIHGGQASGRDPFTLGIHGEDRRACVGFGRHQHEAGILAVDDEHLFAADLPPIPGLGGKGGNAVLCPLAVGLGEGHRGDGVAGCDARQVSLLGHLVAAGHEQVGSEGHRGKEGSAQ